MEVHATRIRKPRIRAGVFSALLACVLAASGSATRAQTQRPQPPPSNPIPRPAPVPYRPAGAGGTSAQPSRLPTPGSAPSTSPNPNRSHPDSRIGQNDTTSPNSQSRPIGGSNLPGSASSSRELFGQGASPGTPLAPYYYYVQGHPVYYYNANLTGRGTLTYYPEWAARFLRGGMGFYPHYRPYFLHEHTRPSVYAYYYGCFPAFIDVDFIYYTPPTVVYVPVPVYDDGVYQGYDGDNPNGNQNNPNGDQSNPNGDPKASTDANKSDDNNTDGNKPDAAPDNPNTQTSPQTDSKSDNQSDPADEYYLNRNRIFKNDRVLADTVKDITNSWELGDIQLLAKHVMRGTRISVFLKGKYEYTLDPGDYLDMTRDAFGEMTTIRFELDRVKKKDTNIYSVSGRHVYRNQSGKNRTVYVSFVLQKMDTDSDNGTVSDYIITQVGSAPDRIEE